MNNLTHLHEMNRLNLSFVSKALEYASKVHKHQRRSFTEEPYINHPIRIANNPEVLTYAWRDMCVALHDCIEDGEYPEEVDVNILKRIFLKEIYEACKLLTHNRLEKSYDQYISGYFR